MTKAKVTIEFKGVEDGKVYPRTIKVGETITGSLAQSAIASGHAVDLEKKSLSAPQNKMMPSPETKSGSASQPARASRRKTAKKSGCSE